MADEILARTVVQIVATGVQEVQSAITALGSAAVKAGQQLKSLSLSTIQGLKSMASSLSRIGSISFEKLKSTINSIGTVAIAAASRLQTMATSVAKVGVGIGAVGGSMLALFGTRALAGTIEAEKFGKAIEMLFRVTGDALAPYVRFATDAITKLARAFYNLSPQTKDLITQVALIATGIGVLSGGILAASSIFSMATPLFMALFAGPIPKLGVITALVGVLNTKLFDLMSVINPNLAGMQKFGMAIVSASTAFVSFGVSLTRSVITGIISLSTAIAQAVASLLTFAVSGVATASASVISFGSSLVTLSRNLIASVIPSIVAASQSAVSMASSFAGVALNAIRQATFAFTVMGLYLAGNLSTAIRALTMNMISLASQMGGAVIASVRSATAAFVAFGVQTMRQVAAGAVAAGASMLSMAVNIRATIVSVYQLTASLVTMTVQALTPVVSSIATATVSVLRFGASLLTMAASAIASATTATLSFAASLSGSLVNGLRSATVSVVSFSAALSVQAVAGLRAAASGMLSLLNPAKLVGVAISSLGGVITLMGSMITGGLGLVGGALGMVSAAILPLIAAFVGFAAYQNGVFAPGINMGERFVRVIKTLLDIWEGLKTVIYMTGESLYTMFAPALDWLNDAFHKVLGSVAKMFGVTIVDSANEGSEKTAKAVMDGNAEIEKDSVSLIENMVGFFGTLRKKWQEFVNFMSDAWNNAINQIAKDMAKFGEDWGIIPKGAANLVEQENEEEKKKRIQKNKEALEKIDKDNKDAMERLKDALKKNKGIAQDMAKPILDMFNMANKGGGFHMKGSIQLEGLDSTWDRLMKGVANISGRGIDSIPEMQLRTMQDVYNETLKMNANLSGIRQAVPAVE